MWYIVGGFVVMVMLAALSTWWMYQKNGSGLFAPPADKPVVDTKTKLGILHELSVSSSTDTRSVQKKASILKSMSAGSHDTSGGSTQAESDAQMQEKLNILKSMQ